MNNNYKINCVHFEVTNICNFKCDFCTINQSERKQKHMDFSLYKKGIDDIVKDKISGAVAYHILGEPFLYPEIFKAINYATEKGLKTDLTTNGSLLTEEVVQKIINTKLTKFTISVETVDEKEHESRGSNIPFKEYYKRILNAIKDINKFNPEINIVLCLMNTSSKKYFDIDRIVRINGKNLYKDKLLKFIIDIHSSIKQNTPIKDIMDKLNKINVNFPKMIKIKKNLGVYIQLLADWGNAFADKKIHPAKFGYCGYAFSNVGILNNGEVTICCVDYDGKTSIGNIKNESLGSIINSEKAKSIREGFEKLKIVDPYCQWCFGSANRLKTLFKGLISVYLFKWKKFNPTNIKEVSIK